MHYLLNNMNKTLFLQPIVSHYRKSVIESIINYNSNVEFWGTADYFGVLPLSSTNNIKNNLTVKRIKLFKRQFLWYNRLIKKVKNYNPDIIVLSGFNPLLINFTLVFLYFKLFTSNKIFWWSQGKPFYQGVLGKFIRRFLYNFSDGILLYSENGKKNFLNEGVFPEKIFVVNNCLNNEDYGFMNYEIIDEKKEFSIIYSGRLSKRKKVDILLYAIGILNKNCNIKIPVNIIGDGEEMESLLKIKDELNLDNVKFLNSLYGEDIHEVFLKSSILVCPGAVGLSIVHAFSFGIPILTGKNDPLHSSELELLEEGINGDYFELDNAESLAEKILFWRNIIQSSRNSIVIENCIQSIKKKGYLPHLVASNIANSIYK